MRISDWSSDVCSSDLDQLAVDPGAARDRLVVVLEHEDAGAVAHDEAVAVAVPGARGLLRLVVAGGQRLHRAEAAERGRRGRVLGATGDHGVGVAVLDHAHRQPDVVRGGGAGGDRGDVGALGYRNSVVSGKSVSVRVDLGGRRVIQTKKHYKNL